MPDNRRTCERNLFMGFLSKLFGSREEEAPKESGGGAGLAPALELHLGGEAEAALSAYLVYAGDAPDQRLPLFLAAMAKAGLGRTAEAAADLRELSARCADAGEGISFSVRQELVGLTLEGFMTRDLPRVVEMIVSFAETLRKEGFLQESAVCFELAAALAPDNAHVLQKFGDILHDLRAYDYAESVLREALELAPNHWGALYTYAVLLQDLGRNEEAIERYRKAVALNPEHARCRNNFGAALLRANQLEEALVQCTAADELEPGSPMVKVNLGNVYLLKNDLEQARSCFSRAIELNPDFALAYFGLASVEKESGADPARIEELYRKATQLDPQIGVVLEKGKSGESPEPALH